jgi:hypothetical protein
MQNLFIRFITGLILLSSLFLFSCEKELSVIGSDIQPPGEKPNVIVVDTFPVTAYIRLEDSTRTDRTFSSLAGFMRDPAFGTSKSTFYVQLRLPANNIEFGTNPVVDSVYLYLTYRANGIYGANDRPITLEVYEMDESIYLDSNYYSRSYTRSKPELLGSLTFEPNLEDSVVVDGAPAPSLIRIPIAFSFAEKLLAESGSTNLSNNANFLEFMKGFEVRCSDGNAILSFDMINPFTNLSLYYHTDEEDSLKFQLLINEFSQRYNYFSHSYSGTEINARPVPGTPMERLYVQGLGGVKTIIELPFLDSLIGKPMAINKAEIRVKVAQDIQTPFDYPVKLILVVQDSLNRNNFLIDQLTEGPEFVGGNYDEANGEYVFNLARHVQSVLLGRFDNFQLGIICANLPINPARVVLKGNGPALGDDRIRFRLIYTEIE